MDQLRAQELTHRIAQGESPHRAWLGIITDHEFGLADWRGREEVSAGAVQRTLSRFVARALTDEEAQALGIGRIMAARLVPEAVVGVMEISRGNFGTRKTADENGEEVIERLDGRDARTRLAALKQLLDLANVIPKPGGPATTVNVNQTVNTGVLVVPASAATSDWVEAVEQENETLQPPAEEPGET